MPAYCFPLVIPRRAWWWQGQNKAPSWNDLTSDHCVLGALTSGVLVRHLLGKVPVLRGTDWAWLPGMVRAVTPGQSVGLERLGGTSWKGGLAGSGLEGMSAWSLCTAF